MNSPVRFLRDVAMTYFPAHLTASRPDLVASLQQVIENLLTKTISDDGARAMIQGLVGNSQPLEELIAILRIGPDPIPPPEHARTAHRTTRPWQPYEDQRLLCGMYRFGIENWTAISKFVGNGRTRSQCSQRWYRGLDPAISKSAWSEDEEARLLALVASLGEGSWTKIAARLGNRSDVQCRYRYKHIRKAGRRLPPPECLGDAAPPRPAHPGAPPGADAARPKRTMLPPVYSLTEAACAAADRPAFEPGAIGFMLAGAHKPNGAP
jgi:hypothetical protein